MSQILPFPDALTNIEGLEICRIQISASGKAAQEINFPITISGETMRLMAGRAIKTCVEGTLPLGGVVTRNIRRTLDWLIAPNTDFPRNLDIRGCSSSIELHDQEITPGTR